MFHWQNIQTSKVYAFYFTCAFRVLVVQQKSFVPLRALLVQKEKVKLLKEMEETYCIRNYTNTNT